jgi:flavodoxin
MNALVVYDSQYGNTERIAQAIAGALAERATVRVVPMAQAPALPSADVDLLILGSPTQGWGPTPAMRAFLANIPRRALKDLSAASFDTRLSKSKWLTGSAARGIAETLGKMGGSLLLPPESFLVTGKEGPLVDGETERAASWARTILGKYEALRPRATLAAQ